MSRLTALLLLIFSATPAWLTAQTAADPALSHQFTYSIIETSGELDTLIQDIEEPVMNAMRLSGARLYGLFTPVEKPADAPFAGLAANQVILMLAWDRPTEELLPSLEIVLRGVAGVSDVTTRAYDPLYLVDGLNISSGPGFYVHRDEFYQPQNVDEVFRLSREAWVTFEPAFGVRVVGLFREVPDRDGIARLNRIFWYPSYEGWLNSRNFGADPESQRRFAERRQYQVEGSGIAFATDRHVP
ncbi:MAG: hypothetical protein RLZZ385_1447 [Pseudomonadota bacterium]|jgi:hypothetical protein